MSNFGKNLRRIRQQKGWSQSRLGDASGICASVVSNYECGERLPCAQSLQKLQKALGCEWTELLKP